MCTFGRAVLLQISPLIFLLETHNKIGCDVVSHFTLMDAFNTMMIGHIWPTTALLGKYYMSKSDTHNNLLRVVMKFNSSLMIFTGLQLYTRIQSLPKNNHTSLPTKNAKLERRLTTKIPEIQMEYL